MKNLKLKIKVFLIFAVLFFAGNSRAISINSIFDSIFNFSEKDCTEKNAGATRCENSKIEICEIENEKAKWKKTSERCFFRGIIPPNFDDDFADEDLFSEKIIDGEKINLPKNLPNPDVNLDEIFGEKKNSAPKEPVVKIFKHCEFGGYEINLPVGEYKFLDLQKKGMQNNDVSAVKINSGYRAIFYENDNFAGKSIIFSADDECFVDDKFNDKTTSVKIEKIFISPSEKKRCEDSDSDENFLERGSKYKFGFVMNEKNEIFNDNCLEFSGKLKEYFCDFKNEINAWTVDCPHGCNFGECARADGIYIEKKSENGKFYRAGSEVTFNFSIINQNVSDPVEIKFMDEIPSDWFFVQSTANLEKNGNFLEVEWPKNPPKNFSYKVRIPASSHGNQKTDGMIFFKKDENSPLEKTEFSYFLREIQK